MQTQNCAVKSESNPSKGNPHTEPARLKDAGSYRSEK